MTARDYIHVDLRLTEKEIEIIVAVLDERINTFNEDPAFADFTSSLDELCAQIKVSMGEDLSEIIIGDLDESIYIDRNDDWGEYEDDIDEGSINLLFYVYLSFGFDYNDEIDIFDRPIGYRRWEQITLREYKALKNLILDEVDDEIHDFTASHITVVTVDFDEIDLESLDLKYPGLGAVASRQLSSSVQENLEALEISDVLSRYV